MDSPGGRAREEDLLALQVHAGADHVPGGVGRPIVVPLPMVMELLAVVAVVAIAVGLPPAARAPGLCPAARPPDKRDAHVSGTARPAPAARSPGTSSAWGSPRLPVQLEVLVGKPHAYAPLLAGVVHVHLVVVHRALARHRPVALDGPDLVAGVAAAHVPHREFILAHLRAVAACSKGSGQPHQVAISHLYCRPAPRRARKAACCVTYVPAGGQAEAHGVPLGSCQSWQC
jgi:hypothetical protein